MTGNAHALKLIVWTLGMASMLSAAPALAQKAKTTTSRNEDGSVRIAVEVSGAGVQDVHLCVARTKHTDTEETTMAGDPLQKDYSNPAGQNGVPALPNGWSYNFVEEPDPAKPGESLWCIVWNNPAAALPGAAPTTFVVDYSGGKDVKMSGKENLFLTSNGQINYAPKDVINGAGAVPNKKGERGHMPIKVFMRADRPLIPKNRPIPGD
jgi:hypothetical protein